VPEGALPLRMDRDLDAFSARVAQKEPK